MNSMFKERLFTGFCLRNNRNLLLKYIYQNNIKNTIRRTRQLILIVMHNKLKSIIPLQSLRNDEKKLPNKSGHVYAPYQAW